ncbi:hypothetical protein F4823DRAFT_581206 [Ustulina deusta]|nr:hypothetical protein F4823DRAFT_581206 [Ustulina deusta]
MPGSVAPASLGEFTYESVPFTLGASSSPTKKKKKILNWKKAQRLWHQGWGVETYSVALAASSLAVIIGILASYEGQTLPEWPLHITLNALISVFTVVLKAGLGLLLTEGISQLKWQWFQRKPRCLMDLDDFDNASRGALGSMSFLFKVLKWEVVSNFARFAAVLTILAAVLDPFSQQLVGIIDCTRESDISTASVARTNAYYANGGHTGPLDSEIDSPMAVAINIGLVNPPNHIPSLVSTTCPSGNCTFGTFSSVAVCHSCDDISSQIKNFTEPTGYYNYSLPATNVDNEQFSALQLAFGVLLNTSAAPSPTHLLNVRIMSAGGDITTITATPPNAFECQLFPCVRTYEASVSKLVLEEAVVSKIPMGFDAFGGYGRYVLATSNLTQYGEQTLDCTPHPANDTAGLVLVALANVDAAPQTPLSSGSKAPGAWYPEKCVWIFGSSPFLAIRPELGSYLDADSIQDYQTTYIGNIVAKNLWRNATTSFDSVGMFMRNLSDVMTATIRNNGANGAGDYLPGRLVLNTTCIDVRWAWLSFPVALVVLAFVFFLMLVVQNPRDSSAMRSWKSSNIAMLFCNLDESIRQETDLTWFRDEIDDVARASRAQLVQDGAGKATFTQD